MKKTILVVMALAVCAGASAQNWQDALLFSENNYSGTARGVGMGNALTAVGGDAGSLTFNPAGSAVAGYSQFMITPGLTISSSSVGASPNLETNYMGNKVNGSSVGTKLPNLGFIVNMDTGKRSGLKRMSFGFVFNSSNNYTGKFDAAGRNDDNSFAASLASSADGYSPDVLGSVDWYYSGDPARMPAWMDMVGYRAGLIDAVSGTDGSYIAITEIMDGSGNFRLGGPVFQRYGQRSYGSKNEALINFAMNFSDKFYLGANLGITTLDYSLTEYWSEEPENPSTFPSIEYDDGTSAVFNSLRMNHTYSVEGVGAYLKVGALWRPAAGLRIGAAVQTPSVMNLRERYGYSASVSLGGKSINPSSSPEDDWNYAIRNPWRFNVGVAYLIGPMALVSADYELANYGTVRFGNNSADYGYKFNESNFSDVNLDIADLLGVSHQIRLGTEVRVTPEWSLRAGYNLTTGAQQNYLYDNGVTVDVKPLSQDVKNGLMRHVFSLGAGYSFGSVFIDVAARMRTAPSSYVTPYYYYYAPDASKFYEKVINLDVETPEVLVKEKFFDLLFTVGWRF